eukprot:CAMPEP_0179346900 /NCGR_PEP_ID=MMETSP0797-20121207/72820_1 /TAXON_ID=47934 /ORGANISM="Dinophysis acuminata, Strain DAEP01" /LENGTH=183 /DNA_ID=CAMNT_0021061479 /DNA_START=21 /DNA_END=569 /DNA_ORIENTATION=-
MAVLTHRGLLALGTGLMACFEAANFDRPAHMAKPMRSTTLVGLYPFSLTVNDLDCIKQRVWTNKHRRYNPGWSWPGEITQILLYPRYLTKPTTETRDLGYEDSHYPQVHQLVEAEVPARRPRCHIPFVEANMGHSSFTLLLAHVRITRSLPAQAVTSQVVNIGKKNKEPSGNDIHDINHCLRL